MTVFILKQLIGQLFRGGHLLYFFSLCMSLPFPHMPGWLSESSFHGVMCVEDCKFSEIITKDYGCTFVLSRSQPIFGFLCFALLYNHWAPSYNVSIILVGILELIVSLSSRQPPPRDLHGLPYHNIGKQFLLTAVNQRQKPKTLPQSLSDFQLVNWFHRLLLSKLHLKRKAEPSIFEGRKKLPRPLGFKIQKHSILWKKLH